VILHLNYTFCVCIKYRYIVMHVTKVNQKSDIWEPDRILFLCVRTVLDAGRKGSN